MNLKRDLLTSFSMLSIFFAFELIPAATTLTPIVTFSTEISTVDILGQVATVTLNKKDTFTCDTHFVSLNASCVIDGVNVMNVTTTEYPLRNIENSLSSSPIEANAIPSEWKYLWDSIWFVKKPGPADIYIKYDHPNNVPPDGDYRPGEVNTQYYLQGTNDIHVHIPQYTIEEDKQAGTIAAVVGALIGIAAALLTIPELFISKIALAAVAIIAAILTAVGILVDVWPSDIVQTELDDG